jgi:hypothetical protein
MTEIEKFDQRIEALEQAITAVQHAATVDRKMSHDKHYNGHFTKALTELVSVRDAVKAHKIRFEAVGR